VAVEKADKSVQFIAKLVQLTQENELRWDAVPNPADIPGKAASAAFTALIDGTRLRTYKISRELRLDPNTALFGRVKPTVVQAPVLEILDDFDQVSYTFDGITGLTDLYESASFSASKVGDLMDSVLRRR
jgi:hypothetical protein